LIFRSAQDREVRPGLSYRTIDPGGDAELAFANYLETCRASFGPGAAGMTRAGHARWLRSRVEEFPDGHVLATLHDECVGQLELQVPYGLTVGYVNLFYVTPPFRGRGFGRLLHDFAERYFRSWEASQITLDVAEGNRPAIGFYEHLGYQFKNASGQRRRVWQMEKFLVP
jgi:ribosomal protein S18 acetylase RimI-like enzyme